jgi:hypothetical protein
MEGPSLVPLQLELQWLILRHFVVLQFELQRFVVEKLRATTAGPITFCSTTADLTTFCSTTTRAITLLRTTPRATVADPTMLYNVDNPHHNNL